MPTAILTQCPGCQTQFNVSPGQLKIAQGRVRCGSCLQVFSALEHQIVSAKNNTRSTVTQPKTKAKSTLASQPIQQKPRATKPKAKTAPPAELNLSELKPQTNTEIEIPTLKIDAETLLLKQKQATTTPVHKPLVIGSLFCIALFITQLLWFNRHQLYWQEQYQPIFGLVCSFIECNLKPRQNIEAITNQQLVVTSHPEYQSASIVTLRLVNQAQFTQPYPALNLTFSDLKGRTIAQRTFQPREYLDLNSTNPLQMRQNQPVQIELEIMSPSARAVSYELTLLAPQL